MIIILISTILLGSNLINQNIDTAKSVKAISWTKAICDENNLCQDYEIICEKKTLINKNPITGAIVQFSEDWTDPRTEEQINRLCD